MAMGLPSSAYWPVRSFVALFIRKHGTLDEHCKNQSCDCWAYHNMLGTSNQLSLSARSPQCKKTIHIPVQRAPLQVVLVQEILDISACVWHHDFFLGTHLQSPASPPIFCRFAIVIWTYFNFGPKVPLECIPWYDQRCAAGRLFCPQGRDQNWVSSKLDGLRLKMV